jgi:4-hydroxy-3-methylbut-2-enyl diphosphate reductase
MEVTVAKTAGFCFGVKRAVEKVYEQIGKTEKPIYTYGPIIHNEQVVGDLQEKGVEVIDTLEELKTIRDAVVVIRSHGVGKDVYDILKENGVEIVDATCPYVKKIHRIVEKQTAEGRRVLIVGSEDHPEVQGIKGWGDERTKVIENMDDFRRLELPEDEKLCIVSQTTFNYKKFQDLVEKISKTRYDITVLNTICNATQERQVEAMRIASQVDVMLVIGGKHSSNTQKLYDICRKECKNTYYIQTLGDFNPECISSVRSVGITAGASTPNNIIEEVCTNVRKFCRDVRGIN